MKLAVYSESEADEAAIRILVDGLRGQPTEPVAPNAFRKRFGWQAVLRDYPAIFRHLFFQTDADALIVVVDSDRSVIHQAGHEQAGTSDPQCRVCELRKLDRHTRAPLRRRPWQAALHVGIGLAVPAIEAWLSCGRDPHVTEAAWALGLQSGETPL